MNRHVLIGLCYCIVAQILVWVQTNSQFIWPVLVKYRLLMALIGGTTVSYLFMTGAGEIVRGYSGQIWPARIIPTATGTFIFTIMTWCFMKQGVDLKTGICIALSFLILAIQLYWKK